jgi:dienelactone hydrolase
MPLPLKSDARFLYGRADGDRSFGGQILIPPGTGPFPVIVFNHGQGGTPQGYPNTSAMRDWGAVVIAPALSHAAGGSSAPETSGFCPENLARGLATVAANRAQSFVDPTRVAILGHSKGAYALGAAAGSPGVFQRF